MFFRGFFGVALCTVPMFFFPVHAGTFSVSVDNDSFVGTDREYSSGLFVRWSSSPGTVSYSVEMGSQLWTPSNIEVSKPQPNERPYAGLFSLKSRGYLQKSNYTYIANVMVGTVGPDSKAEYGQDFIHTLIGSPVPQGWEHQIYNQFVYQMGIDAHGLIARGYGSELSVFGRGQGGNFQSEVAAGVTYRLGADLGNSFGSTSTQAGNNVDPSLLGNSAQGAFLFLTFESRYRFDDITIEGEMPSENNLLTIDKKQLAAAVGGAMYMQDWGVILSMTIQSEPFISSDKNHHTFGNFVLFYRY